MDTTTGVGLPFSCGRGLGLTYTSPHWPLPDSMTPSLVPRSQDRCRLTAEPREPGLRGTCQGWTNEDEDTSQQSEEHGLRGVETWWTVYTTPGISVPGPAAFRMTSVRIKIIPSFIQLEVAVSRLCTAVQMPRREVHSGSRFYRQDVNFRTQLQDQLQCLNTIKSTQTPSSPSTQAGGEGTEVKTYFVFFTFISFIFMFSSN